MTAAFRPGRRRRSRRCRAFTIIELLVVVAIMLTLAALSLPALHSLLPASQLAQASQMLENGIGLARQTALARNALVEVRLYRVADPEMAGETAGNPATGKYRAFQAFVYNDAGTATPLTKPQYFPKLIVADANATLSPLLAAAQAKAWSASDPQPPLPRVGTSYTACVFAFQPDGSTNLAVGQTWFVTVHPLEGGDNLGALPKNFTLLQVDPVNGHVQEYRP